MIVGTDNIATVGESDALRQGGGAAGQARVEAVGWGGRPHSCRDSAG